MPDDDAKKAFADTTRQIAEHMVRWIRTEEVAIERLAAETGKLQHRTIGMQDDSGRILLRIHFTCEPRQFATKTYEGPWAPFLKSFG